MSYYLLLLQVPLLPAAYAGISAGVPGYPLKQLAMGLESVEMRPSGMYRVRGNRHFFFWEHTRASTESQDRRRYVPPLFPKAPTVVLVDYADGAEHLT